MQIIHFTPTFAQVGDTDPVSIYTPTSNWGIKAWSNEAFEYGDIVYDSESSSNTSYLYQLSDKVKGQYLGSAYNEGDFVQSDGDWYKAHWNHTRKLQA